MPVGEFEKLWPKRKAEDICGASPSSLPLGPRHPTVHTERSRLPGPAPSSRAPRAHCARTPASAQPCGVGAEPSPCGGPDRTAPEGLAPFLLETRAPQGGRLRGRSETCSPSPSERSIWTIRACSLEAIAAPEAKLMPEVQGHLLSSWYLFSPPPAPSLQITYTFPRRVSSDVGGC